MAEAENKSFCSLCEEEGVENSAVHWCTDCCSFLCYLCWRHHQRNKASRNHTTITAEDYSKLPDFIKNTTNHCQRHDKRFEIFCSIHECVCCIQCLADDHKTCQNFKTIEEVLSKIKSSASMSTLHDRLANIQHNYSQILTHLEKEHVSVNQQKKDKLKELKDKRKTINLHLDKLESQLKKEIESETDSLIDKLDATAAKVECKRNDVEKLVKDFDAMMNHATNIQTYFGLNSIKKNIKTDTEFLTNIQNSQEVSSNVLKICFSSALDSITKLDRLGDILLSNHKPSIQIKPLEITHSVVAIPRSPIEDIKPIFIKRFNVSERNKPTWIKGCDILSNGDFVIADHKLPYVNYYDNQAVLVKQINTEGAKPFDVCFIDDDLCAISTTIGSSNHKQIIFVHIKTNNVIRKVTIGEGTKFLHYSKKIFIARNEQRDNQGEIICMNKAGNIINRFITNLIGGIFASTNFIYYTECYQNAVVCADKSGTINWRYIDPSILNPWGVVVDTRGLALVACSYGVSVIVTNSNGKSGKVAINSDDGIKEPFALAINREGGKLMVCNKEDGQVFLYQL